jgi:predicted permease
MDGLIQDLRFAFRTLRRRPGFSLAAILTLALGIGANTTVFGLVDSVLLRPPEGVREPERVVAIFTSDFSGPPWSRSSYPDFRDLQRESVYTGVTLWTGISVGVGEGAAVEPVSGSAVSASYFNVLGVQPVLGRFFRAADEEDTPGDIVVVSHAYWRGRLGARAEAVGSPLVVNGRALEIIGVAPAGFVGFDRTATVDLWLPVRTAERAGALFGSLDQRGSRGFNMAARLAPDVSVAQAEQAMQLAAQRLHELHSDAWTDVRGAARRISVLPESRVRVPPNSRGAIVGLAGVLAGAAGLVLLLCCANVAGLLIARAAGRGREVGIRLSLGAGRARLVRQLLTESMLLALLGGAAGIMIAFWSADLFAGMGDLRSALGVNVTLAPDARLLTFAAFASVLTAALFGLAPAFRATRVDVAGTLRQDAPGAGGAASRSTIRGVLVGAQFAVSLVLLVGAMLLVRTLNTAYAFDPGFATENVLLVDAGPLPGSSPDADPAATALRIHDRVTALPGVESASWGWLPPLTGGGARRSSQVEHYQPGEGEDMEVFVDHVGPSFFETLQIPVLRGRSLDARDRAGAPDAVVVNEAFVRRFWPDRDPLGLRIGQMGRDFTVVGVARDARTLSITSDPVPLVYLAALQAPRTTLFYVRTAGDATRTLPAMRQAIEETAAGWIVRNARTMEDQRGRELGGQRLAGGAIGAFAVLAVLLAAIGLYGVVAFAVAQRTREVGIRVALGAHPGEIVGLFLRQALPIVLTGAALGTAAALAAARALRGLLIGVAPTDPLSFAAAVGLLGGVALLATWWPARRAARVDPAIALRME